MKKDILIKRPDGNIPGLWEVNKILSRKFGMILQIEHEVGETISLWKGMKLVPNPRGFVWEQGEKKEKPHAW